MLLLLSPVTALAATIDASMLLDIGRLEAINEIEVLRTRRGRTDKNLVIDGGGDDVRGGFPRSGGDSQRIGTAASGVASASYGYDITTGQLRITARAAPLCGEDCPGPETTDAEARVSVSMAETFTVVGDGTLHFTSLVEGGWHVLRSIRTMASLSVSRVSGGDIMARDGIEYDSLLDDGPMPVRDNQTVREVLHAVLDVVDGDRLSVNQRILGATLNGIVDFGNTMTLSFQASSGVSLVFDDPQFLTVDPNPDDPSPVAPAPVAPIPLPAAGWMLATGLAALWSVKRRRGV